MKVWYVFSIKGKHVGFLALNIEDALYDLKKQYGDDVEYKYIGVRSKSGGPKVNEFNESGVSPLDMIIADYVSKARKIKND